MRFVAGFFLPDFHPCDVEVTAQKRQQKKNRKWDGSCTNNMSNYALIPWNVEHPTKRYVTETNSWRFQFIPLKFVKCIQINCVHSNVGMGHRLVYIHFRSEYLFIFFSNLQQFSRLNTWNVLSCLAPLLSQNEVSFWIIIVSASFRVFPLSFISVSSSCISYTNSTCTHPLYQ